MRFRFPRPMSVLVLVRTTLPSRTDAEVLARRLVDGGLAACAHVSEVASVYRWEGQRRQETEFVVEARTTWAGRNRVVDAMRHGHPYEVPLVESWPVSHVPDGYLRWATAEVR